MNRKVKDLRAGIRLDIKKPPKVEIPKNVYNRKVKHRKGTENENSAPFFIPSLHSNYLRQNFK
jgi:hypothetical protein